MKLTLCQAPDGFVWPEHSWDLGGIVVKRSVDIVVSAVLLLFALPVLALAALLIRLTSPGPALFRQVRIGRSFQPFEIFKLRTMAHAAPGLAYTLGPDPRITPIGRVLRSTKIDELPQLWNVLRGEMSLVGPRPVVPELTEEFREFYALLLRARPGLTDPASLKYREEMRLLAQAPNSEQFFKSVVTPDKIRISLEYMLQANLWTDSVVLAMTPAVCCFPPLSRIYGRLPEFAGFSAQPKPYRLGQHQTGQYKPRPHQPGLYKPGLHQPRPRKLAAATDSSIFTHDLAYHDLAYLEAVAEDASKNSIQTWIPLPLLRNQRVIRGAKL